MKPGLTIVISPLIALMDDQIQNLKKRGIRAESLNSSAGIVEQRKIMEDLSGRGGITELLKLQKLVKKRIYKDLHIPEIPNFDVFKEDLKTLTEDTFDKLTEFIVNLSLDFEVKEDHQEFKDFLVTIQERRQPIKLLYIAPETLLKKEVTELINNSIDISLIVLDEAHCFKEDTFVDTLEGPLTFKELNSRFKNSVQLPTVKSFNVKTQNFEYKKILNVFENPFKQLQRTLVKGGSIDSTPCHVFFTSDGEKPAKDLQVGDKILSSNVVKKYITLDENRLQLVLGSILGDGGISNLNLETNIHRLRFTHCEKQKDYLSWKNKFLGFQELTYIEKNGYAQKPAYSCSTKSFQLNENIFPVTRGTKRSDLSESFFDVLDKKALAIWYMDDGSLSQKNIVSIHCNSFSKELCEKFKLFFKIKFDLTVSIKQSRTYFYLQLDLKNSIKFLELIQEYIHPVFNYKLINKNIEFTDWSLDCKDKIQYSEVVSTRLLRVVNKPQYLYDIEIEDNHNYFVYTKNANGPLTNKRQHNTLLVHNCISSWGTSFRPKYVEIAKVREIFKPVPILALTATADTITRKDIINVLKFKDETTDVYLHPVDRPNISYAVYQKTEEYRQVLKLVQKYSEDTCGLIYCMSRDKAEKMQMFLTECGIACEFFHAGMKVADKKRVQEAYLNKELNLIIATVAFGMGIDRSDVRYVINVDIPNSVEEFSQMSGRASRDGLPADSYVLYSRADANTAQWLLRKSMKNPERLQINSAKITKMVHFCETLKCRRASILKYFGENPSDTYKCGNCNATCCTK